MLEVVKKEEWIGDIMRLGKSWGIMGGKQSRSNLVFYRVHSLRLWVVEAITV